MECCGKQLARTLRYLHEHGAKVIVIGHIGRKPEETLKPVYEELQKYYFLQSSIQNYLFHIFVLRYEIYYYFSA